MKFEKTNFDGLLIIQPDVFEDKRGSVFESFKKNMKKMKSLTNLFRIIFQFQVKTQSGDCIYRWVRNHRENYARLFWGVLLM